MRFIPVHLQYKEMQLGKLYKTLGCPSDDLFFVVRKDPRSPVGNALIIGDVQPHSSLLILADLLEEKCEDKKLQKKYTENLRKYNRREITLSDGIIAAGVCNRKDGHVTSWTNTFGLAQPSDDQGKDFQEGICNAIAEHFKNYGGVPDTGAFVLATGKSAP